MQPDEIAAQIVRESFDRTPEGLERAMRKIRSALKAMTTQPKDPRQIDFLEGTHGSV